MATRSRRTQSWKHLPDERPSAIRDFVTALRDVKDSTSLTQGNIARQAGVSESTFSGYLNGKRVPEPDKLESLYKVIHDDVRLHGGQIPHTFSSLCALRDRARAANGPHFASFSFVAAVESGLPTPDVRPAASSMPSLPQSAVMTAAGVPVPPARGDRHPSQVAASASAVSPNPSCTDFHSADIRIHYQAGRHWDALVLISETAARLPSNAFPCVVSAWKKSGIDEAVESLLKSAAVSRSINAVVNIAAALHEHHQYEEAGVILSAARTTDS